MPSEIKCPACASLNVRFSRKTSSYDCEDCGHVWAPPHNSSLSLHPLRIFLSYGHDANEKLVRRIKADLEARGHDVWFDKNDIKAGDDWRRAITEGILKSQRVLSFLSKHATRDPGVCRDEIAIAIGVKGGNIQTILVESEEEVRPPVNIGHIQWLDMHDWKERQQRGSGVPPEHPDSWEQWYKEKLAEIIRVVESDESRRFAGEIETLNGHLKPIRSEARISQLLGKGFYGRQWLFDAVEAWRNPGTADPQIGSSDSRHPTPDSRPLTPASPPSRLFWIMGAPGVGKSAFAAQLAHTRGDTVIAAQFCEWDKPDHRDARRVVRSLAFQLATRLPDYRKLLLTLPEIAELDRKDPAELFDYLLANPLKTVIGGGRERLLIVIDALDEAGEAGRNPLVEMLARHAPRLPDWLGLVVTSRPESAVQTPLQGLNPFVLDTGTEANRADLRDYLRHQLAPQLQHRSDLSRQSEAAADADHLIGQILEKSEGVFLYAERFCDDVQRGHLSLDHPDQFPQGLGGIFCQYFQRQFPDLEKFRKDIRPALRAILAAREPLPVEILQRLFLWQDEELRDFTRILGSLFPVTKDANGDVIKPYHKSLADWLVDEAKAGEYFVSVKEGHRMLANLGWSDYENKNLGGYLLSHLPAHLHQAKQFDRVYSSLRDPHYLAALGVMRYRALPPAVRLWIPDEFKEKFDDEHGKPGDWLIVQFDGYRPPDSIWRTCVNCGRSLLDHNQGRLAACPMCNYFGSEAERAAFNEFEQSGSKVTEEMGTSRPKGMQVFVSYAPSDAPVAREIAESLANAHCIVWVDIHVEPGINAQEEDQKQVDDAFHRHSGQQEQTPVWLEAGAPHLAIVDCILSGSALLLISDAFMMNAHCRFLVTNALRRAGPAASRNVVLAVVGKGGSTKLPEEWRGLTVFDLTTGPFDDRVEELIRNLKTRERE